MAPRSGCAAQGVLNSCSCRSKKQILGCSASFPILQGRSADKLPPRGRFCSHKIDSSCLWCLSHMSGILHKVRLMRSADEAIAQPEQGLQFLLHPWKKCVTQSVEDADAQDYLYAALAGC